MRSLWLAKQEIGINRTRRNNARIMNISDDKCPNCEQHNEDSKHLNLCTDAGRSKLHREGATKLRRWMAKTHRRTEPTMARVLYDFMRLRNSTSMELLDPCLDGSSNRMVGINARQTSSSIGQNTGRILCVQQQRVRREKLVNQHNNTIAGDVPFSVAVPKLFTPSPHPRVPT